MDEDKFRGRKGARRESAYQPTWLHGLHGVHGCGARTLGSATSGKRKEVEGSFILGIARVRRPSRVIGRSAATALGVFQMRHGSGVEGDLGPFLCILRLGR